ncbi:MAG: pyridoxamine 5'-phosphate oxidase family protein [Pseudomonadota bacterium]
MADQYPTLSEELQAWIGEQPVFFVASAARDGRVNLSPKGQQSLKVLDDKTLLWLNLTGSGNETAAHLLDINRLTIMWCAFAGPPRILRVYGSAEIIHPRDAAWAECTQQIDAPLGARQYFRVHIDLVQTSCGYAVPLMDYVQDRDVLTRWSEKRGVEGIEDYWAEKNVTSLDGQETRILR